MSLSCAWWCLTMILGKGGQGGFRHLPVGQGAPQGGDNDLNAPIFTPQEEMRPLQAIGSMLCPSANSAF